MTLESSSESLTTGAFPFSLPNEPPPFPNFPLVAEEPEPEVEPVLGNTRSGASKKLQTPAGLSEITEKIWEISCCWVKGGIGS